MNNLHYNEKEFLSPDGLKSCAIYHAKICDLQGSRKSIFRVNDCNKGALLINELDEGKEMIAKLRTLATAANKFANYIEQNT